MPSYKTENGSWYCKFYYKDSAGKRKQKKKMGFKYKRDADAWERDFLENRTTDPTISFELFCQKFIQGKFAEWKPLTADAKTNLVNTRILPAFKYKRLAEITPLDIQNFRLDLLHSDLAKTTVREINNTLSSMFNYAVRFYGLKYNPCTQAGPLKLHIRDEKSYLTIDQFNQLCKYGRMKPSNKLLFEVLFWTGIRISEALALTPSDIHPDHISITKNKVFTSHGAVVQDTIKNNRERDVLIHPALYDRLASFCQNMDSTAEIWPIRRQTAAWSLKNSCCNAGLPEIRLHDLRHSHVALLIHLGYYPKAIADRIGDTVQTVLNTYSHIYQEDAKRVVDDLARLDVVPD